MNGNRPKKKWGKPELIILVRGKPGERVLDTCKIGWRGGPEADGGGCVGEYPGCEGCCDPCADADPS